MEGASLDSAVSHSSNTFSSSDSEAILSLLRIALRSSASGSSSGISLSTSFEYRFVSISRSARIFSVQLLFWFPYNSFNAFKLIRFSRAMDAAKKRALRCRHGSASRDGRSGRGAVGRRGVMKGMLWGEEDGGRRVI